MKNRFLQFFCLLNFCLFAQPGTLLYNQLLAEYELADIPDLLADIGVPSFLVDQNFGVELYKIGYETTTPLGDSIIAASGLVVVPKGPGYEFPIFHYDAGTHPYEENLSNLDNEALALAMIAVEGNIAMAPDYIGYGDSPIDIPHPYLHIETEANAGIDLLKATTTFLDDIGISFNNDIILGGYSQGAHAALATLKFIQENNTENYNIKGTFTGAGPYHLSGPVIDSILVGNPIEGYFLPFLIEGYQYMYGDLYTDYDEVYTSPWDSLIPRIFDKSDSLTIEDVSFPISPIDVLNPIYLLAMQTDTNHIIRQHLKSNDLHTGWFPITKTTLYHCSSDDYVPFSSTLNTYNAFLLAGAPDISLVENPTPDLSHVECFTPFLLNLKMYISELNTHAPLGLTESEIISDFNWYSENDKLIIESIHPNSITMSVSTIQGKRVFNSNFVGRTEIPTNHLSKGCYVIQVGSHFFKYIK